MDTRKAKQEVQNARDVLETKGAPIEGTAAGHLILALESLLMDLDNSFGYTYQEVPLIRHKGIVRNADS